MCKDEDEDGESVSELDRNEVMVETTTIQGHSLILYL
jgi:hypothetical protein